MSPSVEALENQYMLLRASLPDLSAMSTSDEQLDQLRGKIVTSRDNYWLATRSILHDDDPGVVALVSQMNTTQLDLQAAIDHLGDIAKILDAITKAVDVGSQLVAKATVL